MKKGFVVSAILYPLLVIALTLILGVIAMSDNRRKILDNMKLEVSEESETDPEMSNSALYYKMKALEEAYAEMSSRLLEERLEELKSETLLKGFPVGSIFTSTTSTNPSSYIGGTWVAYGQGRTLVGVGSNGTSSYSVGTTGGSETHNHSGTIGSTSLTVSQIPSHTHSIPALSGATNTTGNHIHTNFTISNVPTATISWKEKAVAVSASGSGTGALYGSGENTISTKAAGNHSHTVTTVASTTGSIGGGGSHTHTLTVNNTSNRSPYIVVHFWKRTA